MPRAEAKCSQAHVAKEETCRSVLLVHTKLGPFFSENRAKTCPKAAECLFTVNFARGSQTAAMVHSREYQALYQAFHL